MRHWLALVVSATLGAPASPASAQPAPKLPKSVALPDIPTALKNVEAAYGAPEHEMWFTQTYFVKAYNQAATSQGRLTFAAPDKLSFRYTSGDYVVVNGPGTGTYEASVGQYYLQPTKATAYPAVLVLLSAGALAAQCNLTIYPGWQLQFPNGYVLLCDPKAPSPAFTKVLYYVDAASSEVRRVLFLDAQGNRNRFDLDQVQPHPAISWQLFSLSPPPGAVVNGLPAGAGAGGAVPAPRARALRP